MLKDRIKEIGRLIVLHFKQNWPYALAFIAGFTIITAYMYIDELINVPESLWKGIEVRHYKLIREDIMIWFLVAIWLYSFVTMFRGYARRQRLHDTLMLPINRISKFLAEIICTLVIMPAVLVAIWASIDAIDIIYHSFPSEFHSMEWYYGTFSETDFWYAHILILSIHSLITLWQASRDIKLVIGICAVTVAMLFITGYTDIFYPFTFGDINIYTNIRVATSQIDYMDISIIPIKLAKGIQFAFIGAIPFALYTLAYYKFKERNVR